MQQSAYDKVDTYCSPLKQVGMLRLYVDFYRESVNALKSGVALSEIRALPVIPPIIRSKYEIPDDKLEELDRLRKSAIDSIRGLTKNKEVTATVV